MAKTEEDLVKELIEIEAQQYEIEQRLRPNRNGHVLSSRRPYLSRGASFPAAGGPSPSRHANFKYDPSGDQRRQGPSSSILGDRRSYSTGISFARKQDPSLNQPVASLHAGSQPAEKRRRLLSAIARPNGRVTGRGGEEADGGSGSDGDGDGDGDEEGGRVLGRIGVGESEAAGRSGGVVEGNSWPVRAKAPVHHNDCERVGEGGGAGNERGSGGGGRGSGAVDSVELPRPIVVQDESVRKRNRKMLGALLFGTLQRFRENEEKDAELQARRAQIQQRAAQRAAEESERLRVRQRQQALEERKRDMTLHARLMVKAEEKELQLLLRQWTAHHTILASFCKTKANPPVLFIPAVKSSKMLKQLAEQHKAVAQWAEEKEGEIKEYLKASLEERLAAVESQIGTQEARLVGGTRGKSGSNGNERGEREEAGGAESTKGDTKMSVNIRPVVRRGLRAVGEVEDMEAQLGEEVEALEGEDHFEFGLDEPGNDDGDGGEEGEREGEATAAGDAGSSLIGGKQVKKEVPESGDDGVRQDMMDAGGSEGEKEMNDAS